MVKSIPIQGKDGKMQGSRSVGGKTPPVSPDDLRSIASALPLNTEGTREEFDASVAATRAAFELVLEGKVRKFHEANPEKPAEEPLDPKVAEAWENILEEAFPDPDLGLDPTWTPSQGAPEPLKADVKYPRSTLAEWNRRSYNYSEHKEELVAAAVTALKEHAGHPIENGVKDLGDSNYRFYASCKRCGKYAYTHEGSLADCNLIHEQITTGWDSPTVEQAEVRAIRAALDTGPARVPEGWGPLPQPNGTKEDVWNSNGPSVDLIIAMDGMGAEYDSPCETFTAAPIPMSTGMVLSKDIARIDLYDVSYYGEKWSPGSGTGSELSMLVLAELRDGRWLVVSAGNDYTGWGCQDWTDKKVANTREDAIRYGLDKHDRVRLGLEEAEDF